MSLKPLQGTYGEDTHRRAQPRVSTADTGSHTAEPHTETVTAALLGPPGQKATQKP